MGAAESRRSYKWGDVHTNHPYHSELPALRELLLVQDGWKQLKNAAMLMADQEALRRKAAEVETQAEVVDKALTDSPRPPSNSALVPKGVVMARRGVRRRALMLLAVLLPAAVSYMIAFGLPMGTGGGALPLKPDGPTDGPTSGDASVAQLHTELAVCRFNESEARASHRAVLVALRAEKAERALHTVELDSCEARLAESEVEQRQLIETLEACHVRDSLSSKRGLHV
jgi:septin family protein